MLNVLAKQKQSVRHIFYRVTDPSLLVFVEKSEGGYRQVQHLTTKLRRNGRLPYGLLTDSSRMGYHVDTYNGAADFLRRTKELYRADLWQYSETYCEVWVESRSIAGVLLELCQELAVSLYPAGGFSSITFIYEACMQINETVEKPVTIFYVGDYDQAGVLVDKAIEREMRRHLRPDIDLTFKRIAITKEQIEQYDLPSKPRKKTDTRSKEVKRTVEAEAMLAEILVELLRSEIEALLPQGALAVSKVAEQSEQQYLEMFAKRIEKRKR